MKQKTITTDKATLLVVEVPEGAHSVRVCKHIRDGIHYLLYDGGINTAYKEYLPDGNWQLIGRIPDITEEQAERIVSSRIKGGGLISYPKQKCFKDYKNGGYPKGLTSLYSLKTLLQANEVYFENPIPPFIERLEDFKEAQSKVWDKERTYLFKKV